MEPKEIKDGLPSPAERFIGYKQAAITGLLAHYSRADFNVKDPEKVDVGVATLATRIALAALAEDDKLVERLSEKKSAA